MRSQKVFLLTSFLLLFFFQILNLTNSQDLCHPYDKKVLLRIKNHFGNPSSLQSWDPHADCCGTWNNVQCNEQGHVTSLGFIMAYDIHGPFPPFLDQLPRLTDFYFSIVPNLSGPIPSYIGKLTNLTSLTISDTMMSGPIPDFLARLPNLVQLFLTTSQFSGPVPDSLGRLKKLEYLVLSSNTLRGHIPQSLAQLTNLSFLDLSSNKLTGPIPEFLTQLKNLNGLKLEANSLVGPIPASLGLLPELTSLSLSHNQLSGPIPKNLGRGTLALLSLGDNKFTGDASFLFEKTNANIIDIQVENNRLSFDFSKVDLARTLTGFNVSHNMIYGCLPKRFSVLRVDSVDVSYNQLCGPIPNGRRFKGLPTIFAHNKCLCGGPLRVCK